MGSRVVPCQRSAIELVTAAMNEVDVDRGAEEDIGPETGSTHSPASRVTSVVLFVAELERSIEFYRDVFSCQTTVQEPDAALLRAPDGFQIYLIDRGTRTAHLSGGIGLQYLIWAVDDEAELDALAQAFLSRAGHVDRYVSGGVTFVAARDPDGIRVLVALPSPEKLHRSVVGARLYI
jgi:catechol 2,3-dioxygenase-like lactoylglutathione lyase family enzyme